MKKKTFIFLAAVLAVCFLINAFPGRSDAASDIKSVMESNKPVSWKFAHAAYEGELACKYVEKIIEEIEKNFEGKVVMEHFPAGQLGSYEAMQESLQNGILEFNMPVTVSFGQIVPECKVTSINFILHENYEVTERAINEGKAFALMEKKLEDQNIKVLYWFLEDFSCWSSNVPIQKLEDLDGLKIRVYPSSQIVANYRALNANPTEIPYAEVYSALQLHVADAQENPITIIYANKFYEVQKYVIESNHTGVINAIAVSNSFWNSLAEEDQARIEKAISTATKYAIKVMNENLQYAKEQITASGNTTILQLDPKERARMAEASVAARELFLKDTGEQGQLILDMWLEDVKKYEAEVTGK